MGRVRRLRAAGATLCIPECVNKINYKRRGRAARDIGAGRKGVERVAGGMEGGGGSHGGHPNGIFSPSLIIQLVLT